MPPKRAEMASGCVIIAREKNNGLKASERNYMGVFNMIKLEQNNTHYNKINRVLTTFVK